MGNSHSEDGIKNKEVEKLKEQTEFSGHEIREWHKKFHEDFPSGEITKEEFIQMYKELFPHGDATRFGQRVFEVRLKFYRICEDLFHRLVLLHKCNDAMYKNKPTEKQQMRSGKITSGDLF